jgi:FSR family fosmidomycin resistance protein-like MFS transporter
VKNAKNIILLASGHGLNDLIAGYFLGTYASDNSDLLKIGLAITIYNILAFGGQYPVAILLEKMNGVKKIIIASYILNVIAVTIFLFSPVPAIVIAGIASAIYHVAGGSYCAENNKALNIGLFAAPGVAGLISGGFFAWKQYNIIGIILPVAIAFLFILIQIKFTKYPDENKPGTGKHVTGIDQHDIIMILLLIIISLRSVTWNVFQLIHENNYEWLIAIAAAAVVGKIAGGWLADRIGWRLYAISSAIIATPLLTFFKKEMLLFCLGIGLLQSGIPATTSLLIQSLKGNAAKGISLSFGVAVIIGAAATVFPSQGVLQLVPYILLASIVMLMFCIKWYRRTASSQI